MIVKHTVQKIKGKEVKVMEMYGPLTLSLSTPEGIFREMKLCGSEVVQANGKFYKPETNEIDGRLKVKWNELKPESDSLKEK